MLDFDVHDVQPRLRLGILLAEIVVGSIEPNPLIISAKLPAQILGPNDHPAVHCRTKA
jgi:hypothetical protein